MKIAIVVEGTRGDVYPMLALGRSLATAGHGVRLCAPPDFEPEIRAADLEFISLGVNIRDFMNETAVALHTRGLSFYRETARFGDISLAAQLRVLPEATADVDQVIAAGTILAAASAAELNGAAYRYVAYTPALIPAWDHTPAALPFQLRSRAGNRLAWWVVRRMLNVIPGRAVNRGRKAMGLKPVRDMLRHILSDRPILAVDRHLGSLPEDCTFSHDQIRCLHPLAGEPLPDKLESFLAQGPAPVYLGFGSMPDPDPVATTARLLDAIGQLGCRALISSGWAGLGGGPLPEGVMAIAPCSHASLFPRCAAVVHHGGAGTTHSAARAGVPQIVVPHVLDQYYFAKRVEALGVGPPTIARSQLSVDRLVETIRATQDNELLAERARALGQQLAELGSEVADPEVILR